MGYFCPDCGAKLAQSQKCCPYCGAELSDRQRQSKAAARGSLTGTAFIEKAKGWESPQKNGRRPGFVILGLLLGRRQKLPRLRQRMGWRRVKVGRRRKLPWMPGRRPES